MKKIEESQENINQVKNKGQYLIEKYADEGSEYRARIEEQLANVQNSYDSLKQNAINIKVSRLLGSN